LQEAKKAQARQEIKITIDDKGYRKEKTRPKNWERAVKEKVKYNTVILGTA
jgi:hypothetical protein